MNNSVFFRFSNYKNYNALQQHEIILQAYGYVYWGIWKKEYEHFVRDEKEDCWIYYKQFPDDIKYDNMKIPSNEFSYYLLNVNDRFVCKINGEIISEEAIDDEIKIPAYYRNNRKDIKYWLKIRKIENNIWDNLYPKFKGNLNLASDDVVLFFKEAPELIIQEMTCGNILHISDLHFCDNELCLYNESITTNSSRSTANYPEMSLIGKIKKCVADKNLKIGLIIATGDFIHAKMYSYTREEIKNYYTKVLFFLNELCNAFNLDPKNSLILVPGNHDIQLEKVEEEKINNTYDCIYKWFQHTLIGEDQLTYIRQFSCSIDDNQKIPIIFSCFNSCDLASVANKDYGFIEFRQFNIFDYYDKIDFNAENSIHFSTMHHPVMGPRIIDPVPQKTADNNYISNPVSVVSNRFEVCAKLQQYKVKCLLNGHQHIPYCGIYDINDVYSQKIIKMNYLVAGSASLNTKNSGMYNGTKNSFSIYTIKSTSNIKSLTCFYECNDTSMEYRENDFSL